MYCVSKGRCPWQLYSPYRAAFPMPPGCRHRNASEPCSDHAALPGSAGFRLAGVRQAALPQGKCRRHWPSRCGRSPDRATGKAPPAPARRRRALASHRQAIRCPTPMEGAGAPFRRAVPAGAGGGPPPPARGVGPRPPGGGGGPPKGGGGAGVGPPSTGWRGPPPRGGRGRPAPGGGAGGRGRETRARLWRLGALLRRRVPAPHSGGLCRRALSGDPRPTLGVGCPTPGAKPAAGQARGRECGSKIQNPKSKITPRRARTPAAASPRSPCGG